ncbi:MAG: c-type cytochrome biogenesis protein CcmI [Alphaproteobacteria bacterium]|nr:c-type cytochrome biogenesis protein CcmI [Alphaproteobacteria bacterium]
MSAYDILMWLVVGLLILLTVGLMILPLLRWTATGASRRDHDLALYRDQLGEVERDLDRGVLEVEQAGAARTEIERRLLQASTCVEVAPDMAAAPWGQRLAIAAVAVFVPIAVLAIYGYLGAPSLPNVPLAERQDPARQDGGAVAGRGAPAHPPVAGGGPGPDQADLVRLAEQLAERLEREPHNTDGWALLGGTYWVLGQLAESAAAYRSGVDRAGGPEAAPSALVADYAEALVFANNNLVSPQAEAWFGAALASEAGMPKARYYLALGRAQRGDMTGAIAGWRGLEADSPPDAPWLESVRRQIENAATRLGVDPKTVAPERPSVASLPRPPQDAAPPPPPAVMPGMVPPIAPRALSREEQEMGGRMAPEDRGAFIRSMVERLASRLEENPNDAAGWLRLGRAYGVLGENDKAREALGRASTLFRRELTRLPAGSPERGQIEQQLRAIETGK